METLPQNPDPRQDALDNVVAELNRCSRLLGQLEMGQFQLSQRLARGFRTRPTFFSVFWPVSFALAFGVPVAWFALACLIALIVGGTTAVAGLMGGILRLFGL